MSMWVCEELWGQHLPTCGEESGAQPPACPMAPFPVLSHCPCRALPATVTHGDRRALHAASLPWRQYPVPALPGCTLCGCPWHSLPCSHLPAASTPAWQLGFVSLGLALLSRHHGMTAAPGVTLPPHATT